MITDAEFERLHAAYSRMSEKQKSAVKRKAEKLRKEALQWPPFEHPQMEELRGKSAGIAQTLADMTDAELDGFAYACEACFLESLKSPEAVAIDAAMKYLRKAWEDQLTKANKTVLHLLESAYAELVDMSRSTLPDELFYFVKKEALSARASMAARSKNIKPRAWVVTAWSSRLDKDQSKAAFARQYAPLVKKRYGLAVTPETIARDWLPATGK